MLLVALGSDGVVLNACFILRLNCLICAVNCHDAHGLKLFTENLRALFHLCSQGWWRSMTATVVWRNFGNFDRKPHDCMKLEWMFFVKSQTNKQVNQTHESICLSSFDKLWRQHIWTQISFSCEGLVWSFVSGSMLWALFGLGLCFFVWQVVFISDGDMWFQLKSMFLGSYCVRLCVSHVKKMAHTMHRQSNTLVLFILQQAGISNLCLKMDLGRCS